MEVALELLLDAQETITSDSVKAVVGNAELPDVPLLLPGKIDLVVYDHLLAEVGT